MSVKVVFVCWGNICRSPMAARVAEKRLAEEGLDAEVTSAGVSDEEHGGPMDRRARAVLDAHGYRSGGHHAHKITRAEIEGADLVVAAEPVHVSMMKRPRARRRHRAAHRLRPGGEARVRRPRPVVRRAGGFR